MSESKNIHRIQLDDREIILIGTAHVSQASAKEVKNIIEEEKPDTICVELDPGRYESIVDPDRWKNADIVKVIKNGKAGFLFVNIILSNYQRKLAEQFNINTGQEMLTAIEMAKETGAELVLADRDIQTTFTRIWRGCSLWEKCKLLVSILMSVIDNEEISEEEMEELKTEDMLTAALSELGENFSGVKKHLVDERDQFLSHKISHAPGKKIVAVLGAAHIPGVINHLDKDIDMDDISSVPPKSKAGKIIGWSIPILLIALVVATFSFNPSSGWDQTRNWLILTTAGAGIGTLLSLAHPLSILTAIVMSPISALSPVLATGWFAGLMEAHMRKPKVCDFEALATDLSSIKGFWKNKVTKILLVVILSNVGCAIGNIAGSFHIIQVFFQTIFG